MVMGSGEPVDSEAIIAAVSAFQSRLGNVVHEVQYRNTRDGPYEPSPLTPREARLTVAPGIHQDGGYFDMQWWTNGDYKYHYRERDLKFRFGREADNADTDKPVRHFHPPDSLDEHRLSCIADGNPPELVTIAVGSTWFAAVKESDPSRLNQGDNLP